MNRPTFDVTGGSHTDILQEVVWNLKLGAWDLEFLLLRHFQWVGSIECNTELNQIAVGYAARITDERPDPSGCTPKASPHRIRPIPREALGVRRIPPL